MSYMQVNVNWCPALGTVLANEEIIDGKSERGGHPVVRQPLRYVIWFIFTLVLILPYIYSQQHVILFLFMYHFILLKWRQWVLKITEYADRLEEDLDGLQWPEGMYGLSIVFCIPTWYDVMYANPNLILTLTLMWRYSYITATMDW